MLKKSLLITLLMALFMPLAMNAQQSLPYSYGFENNDLSADGWTAQVSSSYSGISDYAAHTGSYGFRFNYSENPGYLVSPLLQGGDNGVDVSFYYSEYSSSYGDEQFYVGYTTDQSNTDPSTFTYGSIITASTSWAKYENSFPKGTKRIAIQYVYNDAFYLYLDDFLFEAPASCAKPTNLSVNYQGGTTATATWEGNAKSYNIDVNGSVTEGVTSPYTISCPEAGTIYSVKVQANCGGGDLSAWTDDFVFATDCDAYGLPYSYGFEDNTEIVCWTLYNTSTANDMGIMNNATYAHNGSKSFLFCSYDQDTQYDQYLVSPELNTNSAIALEFYYRTPNGNGTETFNVGYSTTDNNPSSFTWGDVVSTNTTEYTLYEETFPAGTKFIAVHYSSNYQYYLIVDDFSFTVASGCLKPSGLEANQIGTNSALLSWIGDNDSYVLQYRTAAQDMNMNVWQQVGTDVVTTGVLTNYTFDLSSYSGTGYVAIRHYKVSDMFRINVDDIVITNAKGEEVLNEGFEEGAIPSGWDLIDYDGDGENWYAVTLSTNNGHYNGNYCVTSASYNGDALTPDNWLIIPNVELGGTMTLWARGQDASWAGENFGVFVATESYASVPAGEWITINNITETSYQLNGLTANTPYEWQVKGVCGENETTWVSSTFATIPAGFKTFVTAGNWNVDENWFPTGAPTLEDEVSIEAAAIIPSGVVATAKSAAINGGSILIKDGGQLKQGAATLRVTFEKEITGYGSGNGNWYFIASPLSGRTLYEESGTWNRVDNMLVGDYDLYAFDPENTGDEGESLEWVNYKSSPTHVSFQSDNGNAGLMYGEGYLYANKAGTTMNFIGSVVSSLINIEPRDFAFNDQSEANYNGWALVGNPYSCNGYINYINAKGEVLEADFYTMNSAGTGYELSSSSVALPPCVGALINYSATGKVQYSTEAPAGKSGMLNMTVTEGRGSVDQARIRFGEGYNLGKMNFRNNSSLYIPQNGNDYAVVYSEGQGEMPVNFKAEKNGTYTLSFSNENVEFGYLHLIDNMTGADIDLIETPSYSFNANITDYASRFKLVFATGNNSNDNFAFYSNGNIVVNNNGEAILNIVDVLGRTISSQTINGSENVSINAKAGVYTLQLIQGEKVMTQKIVVE